MAVYKEEKTGTWRAVYRYTDWNGERKQTQKRGFQTKREAQAWEREQVHKTSAAVCLPVVCVAIHTHCLPVVSDQKSTDTENGA